MTPLENYLRELRDIRSSGAGVPETSYYAALSNLLNEVGKKLKPRVRCVIHLADRGAGLPDGGLFTAEQFRKRPSERPLDGQKPLRGAIEVKPAKDDAFLRADGEQVSRYWREYRQVLVTNYRDFVLIGQDREGRAVRLESFRLAGDEREFWRAAAAPRALDQKLGERFVEFLHRVMLHPAPLAAPEDVAWFLASYAREALARVEETELPALGAVRAALEDALGLKFSGAKGEHFFRSSLVQTLFYGVFSAWVLWAKKAPTASAPGREGGQRSSGDTTGSFDWRLASSYLRVPMISKLFYLIADPNQLENLNLIEVLDWTQQVLSRVDPASFFERFQESHAVQYFYEPFLEAFDPELRKELGVWYTPPEIVQYMVERVDRVLRSELNVPLGLADKKVYVLDPCCGTGSYLVEVLNRIHRTLKERGEDALLASDLKEAAQKRVFGFEILPAPFVVSHLQLGLLLQNLGAALSIAPDYDRPGGSRRSQTDVAAAPERVGVYLTNALTGWEPPRGPKQHLIFKEMEEERDAAEHVKREVPILVILGNPPYNAFAGVSPDEEQGLVEPYKEGLISEWGIKKFNLDDLYVRFFRLAERRIVQGPPGKGVVCFISNFSYLSDPSFVVMRKQWLGEFNKLWFDCMNGDSRETGKLTPDGKPDPSVFSTERNREGIRVGTAIGLLVRGTGGSPLSEHGQDAHATSHVRFRHFWGVTKNAELLQSPNDPDFEAHYRPAQPDRSNRYSFRPEAVSGHYRKWVIAADLAARNFNGPVERRGNSLIVFEGEAESLATVEAYLDKNKADEEIRSLEPRFMTSSGEFKADKARKLLKGKAKYEASRVVRYPFKPFDVRLAYLDSAIQPLFSRPSPELLSQRDIAGNSFFITRDTADKDPEGPPFYFSRLVCDYDCISGHARHFPALVHTTKAKRGDQAQAAMKLGARATSANLSTAAHAYLSKLGIENPGADAETAGLIWMHALAIGYSPAYLSENADGIRQDWPRIPLPDSKGLLLASAALGKQVAALLDTEAPFDVAPASRRQEGGEASGALALQKIAVSTLVEKRPLREKDVGEIESDLALTAGWGHAGKGGVTMPGKGRVVERDYEPGEIGMDSRLRGNDEDDGAQDGTPWLGKFTLDVYLNDGAYWKNIPVRVWEYTIGGYQVIKKWLSYREKKMLGRPLTKEEVRYVQEMARRIAAILLLEPELDENYRAVKASAYGWPAA